MYAKPLRERGIALVKVQQETKSIKSSLIKTNIEKERLMAEIKSRDEKIKQLEQENASLK